MVGATACALVALGGAPLAHAEVRCSGDGALLKVNDGSLPDAANVYYLLRGRRWLLPDEQVTWALGLSFDDVCRLPLADLEAIPQGPNIGLEGSLFLCPSCVDRTAVYRIDEGERRHIANEQVMHVCLGISDNDIFTVATPAFVDMFPPGWEIEADCEPDSVEADSCGACGSKARTCGPTCTWSTWSSCSENACEASVAEPSPNTVPATGTGCSGTEPGSAAVAAWLALVTLMRTRRRRSF